MHVLQAPRSHLTKLIRVKKSIVQNRADRKFIPKVFAVGHQGFSGADCKLLYSYCLVSSHKARRSVTRTLGILTTVYCMTIGYTILGEALLIGEYDVRG